MTTGLDTKKCPVCGIRYAVDSDVMAYKRSKKSDHEDAGWYCPNGHHLVFTESTADRLQKQLDKERQRRERLQQNEAYLEERLESERRRSAAFKGQATKLRKRAKHGVCPCCNRSFANLARHMKTKHPDFEPEAPEGTNIVPIEKSA